MTGHILTYIRMFIQIPSWAQLNKIMAVNNADDEAALDLTVVMAGYYGY